jgi:hypothetical protein
LEISGGSFEDGSALNPAISFADDTDTGFYRPASGTIGVTSDGTAVAFFAPSGLVMQSPATIEMADGSAAVPSLAYVGDPDTGLFRLATGTIGFVSDAEHVASFASNGLVIQPGNEIELNTPAGSNAAPSSKNIFLDANKTCRIRMFDRSIDGVSVASLGTDNMSTRVDVRDNNTAAGSQVEFVLVPSGGGSTSVLKSTTTSTRLLVGDLDITNRILLQESTGSTADRLYQENSQLRWEGQTVKGDNVVSTATSQTMALDTDILRVTADLQTITLPASPTAGKRVIIVAIVAGTTTIDANAGQTIDNLVDTSISLTLAYEHVTLVFDGAGVWLLV